MVGAIISKVILFIRRLSRMTGDTFRYAVSMPASRSGSRRFEPESIIREAPPLLPHSCNPYTPRGPLYKRCEKERTDRVQSIANITLRRIQNFHRTEGHDRLRRSHRPLPRFASDTDNSFLAPPTG